MLNFDWDYAILGSILFAIGLIVLGFIAYGVTWVATPYGPTFVHTATVKALGYVGSSVSSGTGIGVMANGQIGNVITTNISSDQFNVVLKLDTGKSWNLDNKYLFEDVEQGEKLNINIRSKKVWGEDNWDLVSWEHLK